ncbi:hypothetical protein SAMN05216167_11680 [Spirosoma endophyticum]|uniref:Lipocalin-like domain-containing protein n=1 Tax=Spirosoma endophyticum TaxID=662367 RepID=A0A1I2C2B4_9BACT|nr:hypothetical protein SAMN05216167_11680 [Spirosoma endophyticum]
MKGRISGIIILIAIGFSCRRDNETVPIDLLYRKWKITQVQYATGNPVMVSPTDAWAIVTFKSNGTILYGDDGKYDPCCSPSRFNRKGNTLDLVDVVSIPIPDRTPNGTCVGASCVSYGNSWKIVSLNTSQLVLYQNYATVVYEPYP